LLLGVLKSRKPWSHGGHAWPREVSRFNRWFSSSGSWTTCGVAGWEMQGQASAKSRSRPRYWLPQSAHRGSGNRGRRCTISIKPGALQSPGLVSFCVLEGSPILLVGAAAAACPTGHATGRRWTGRGGHALRLWAPPFPCLLDSSAARHAAPAPAPSSRGFHLFSFFSFLGYI
jgi:hypothetical protein